MGENQEILNNLYLRLKEIDESIKKLQVQKDATKNAIIGFGGSLDNLEIKDSSIYSINYPINSTIRKKILFALKELKKATAGELAQFMAEKEHKEKDNFFNTVTITSSAMYTEGIIKAEKDGKKNIYYL